MNLSRTKKIVGVVALVIVLAATAVIGFAQGRKRAGDRRGGFGHVFRGLDLTQEQQTQIKQIMERNRQNIATLREQLRGSRGVGGDMLTKGAFDEQAVRSAAQARAALQVELEVAHARMLSEMYAVLTPEQKTKLAETRQQREQRRKEWKQRRNSQQGGNAPTTAQ